MSTVLKRQIGMEMEGYVRENPCRVDFGEAPFNAERHYDGSLSNNDYDSDDDWASYGIEVACYPTTDVETLITTHKALNGMGWFVDDRASSHIHVDASDFTPKDRAKLMMFNSLLKEIPFMLVSPSRFGNRYCRAIETSWDTVFEDERINWDAACSGTYGSLRSYLSNHNLSNTYPIEKYQWTNIHTNYSTVEFRIFNGVTTEEEIRNFSAIAHNTVELVKHTSVEQLQFIVAEIWQSTSVDELLGKYLQAISIDESIPTVSISAISTVEQKLNRPKRYSKMLSEISIPRAN